MELARPRLLSVAHLLCYVGESVGDEEGGVDKSVEASAVSGGEGGRRSSYASVPTHLIQLVQLWEKKDEERIYSADGTWAMCSIFSCSC